MSRATAGYGAVGFWVDPAGARAIVWIPVQLALSYGSVDREQAPLQDPTHHNKEQRTKHQATGVFPLISTSSVFEPLGTQIEQPRFARFLFRASLFLGLQSAPDMRVPFQTV